MHVSWQLVIFFFLIFSIVNVMRELQHSLPSDNTAQPIISLILKVTEYVLNSNEGKFTVVLFAGIHWMIITVNVILFYSIKLSYLYHIICTILFFSGYTNMWNNLGNFSLGSLNEITEQVNCFYFSKARY